MDSTRLAAELRVLAEHLGLDVRVESLDGAPGGLCVLKGRRLVLIDADLSPDAQADVLADALRDLCAASPAATAALDELYLLPEVRQFLDGFCPDA